MDLDDPANRAAVTDLLGVLAYGELTASLQMGADGVHAPSLTAQAGMARLAAADYRHYELLADRMGELGIDPPSAMEPFVIPFAGYHERTRPRNWLEGLVKAYVGDGIARDFYKEMAILVDGRTRDVMAVVLDDRNAAAFVVDVVTRAIEADRTLAGPLALWGRRLLGEALSQGQAVAAERDALTALLVRAGTDVAELSRMFTRLQHHHQVRMASLGLQA